MNGGDQQHGAVSAPRRTVSAESFRRLTALLKKPVVATATGQAPQPSPALPIPELQIPELQIHAAPPPPVLSEAAPEAEHAVAAAGHSQPLVAVPVEEPVNLQTLAPEVLAQEARAQEARAQEAIVLEPETAAVAPQAIEFVPEAVEAAPEAIEIAPQAIELAPEAVEVAPEAVEAAPQGATLEEALAAFKTEPAASEPEPAAAPALSPAEIWAASEVAAPPEPEAQPSNTWSEIDLAELLKADAAEADSAAIVPAAPELPLETAGPEASVDVVHPPALEEGPESQGDGQVHELALPPPAPSAESAEEPVAEPPLHAAYDAAKLRRSHLTRKVPDSFSQVLDTAQAPAAEKAQDLTPEQQAEKAELARSLLDMMAAGGGQPQERALAADTLLRMLPQLPARTRMALAQRLTIMDQPPPFLVSRLITDPDLNISGPLLEDCSHISDEDLFAIIQSGDIAKCRLVARRRKISRPIAEALANQQDVSILLTLVRNAGAEIPQEGFAALATMANHEPDLLAPMCTRSDLPVHFAFELFWSAPAQLRRYLFSRFLTDSEMLTKILKITMGSEAENSAEPTSMDLETLGHTLEQVMGGEREDSLRALAAAAKINPATVARILGDNQGEPLMALLKVIGVPRSALEAALPQMTQGPAPLIDPRRSLDEVQAVFDQLSFNKARILLTYWDWASTKSGPYAPAH